MTSCRLNGKERTTVRQRFTRQDGNGFTCPGRKFIHLSLPFGAFSAHQHHRVLMPVCRQAVNIGQTRHRLRCDNRNAGPNGMGDIRTDDRNVRYAHRGGGATKKRGAFFPAFHQFHMDVGQFSGDHQARQASTGPDVQHMLGVGDVLSDHLGVRLRVC